MTIQDHATLAPSSAARLVQCPGSRAMQEACPEQSESAEAAEGTAAHFVARIACELGELLPVGARCPNGVLVDQEMIAGAAEMRDAVAQLRFMGYDIRIEQRVTMTTNIHALNWGTPDIIATKRDETGVITDVCVIDYKYGHRHVSAYRNWQTVNYGASVPDEHGFVCARRYKFAIIQPRCYAVADTTRRWDTTERELLPMWREMHAAYHAAMRDDAPLGVGPECRDCRARHVCPALADAAANACDVSHMTGPRDMPINLLAREYEYLLRHAELIQARISGVAAVLEDTLRGGGNVPGYELQHSGGRRAWSLPADQLIELGKMLGVDFSTPGALSPAQAEAKGIPKPIIDKYAVMQRGSAKLTKVSPLAALAAFKKD